jgi:hypothetical protein
VIPGISQLGLDGIKLFSQSLVFFSRRAEIDNLVKKIRGSSTGSGGNVLNRAGGSLSPNADPALSRIHVTRVKRHDNEVAHK